MFNNLDKIYQFPETYKSVTRKAKNVSSSWTEIINKNILTKGPDNFTGEFHLAHRKGIIPVLHKPLQKAEEEGILSEVLCIIRPVLPWYQNRQRH